MWQKISAKHYLYSFGNQPPYIEDDAWPKLRIESLPPVYQKLYEKYASLPKNKITSAQITTDLLLLNYVDTSQSNESTGFKGLKRIDRAEKNLLLNNQKTNDHDLKINNLHRAYAAALVVIAKASGLKTFTVDADFLELTSAGLESVGFPTKSPNGFLLKDEKSDTVIWDASKNKTQPSCVSEELSHDYLATALENLRKGVRITVREFEQFMKIADTLPDGLHALGLPIQAGRNFKHKT